MDFHMRLSNDPSTIGPTSDFAFKWAMNAGLAPERALGLSPAVTEVVTDVIRFAFPRSEGDFDGVGFAVMCHFVDDFAFLNKGRQGKEFRLVQKIKAKHVSELLQHDLQPEPEVVDDPVYDLLPITPEDAGDVAKLIYRTYYSVKP